MIESSTVSEILPPTFGEEMNRLYSELKTAAIGVFAMMFVTVTLIPRASAADLDLPPRLAHPGEQLPASNGHRPFSYLGLYGGIESGDSIAGVVAGVEPTQYFRIEVQYDHGFERDLDLLTANGILQVKGPLVTPYVLGGVGYFWTNTEDDLALTAGAGVRVKMNHAVELDVRYRRVFDLDADLITAGFNIKF